MLNQTLLEIVDVVDSTNDTMSARLREGVSDGAALVAREQRAGRGRRGKGWTLAPGSLAMSVALRGDVMRRHLLRLPLGVAVAAAEGLERLQPELKVGLKWPNDLEVEGRKVGGILCEAVFRGAEFVGVVVGVGINLRAPEGGWPGELAGQAASLEELCDAAPSLEETAGALRAGIVSARDTLILAPQELLARWRARDVLRGEQVCARVGERRLVGLAEGIDDAGALQIREGETLHRLSSGEVTRVRRKSGVTPLPAGPPLT